MKSYVWMLNVIHINRTKKDMSVKGSSLIYENNNHIVNELKKHSSNTYSSNFITRLLTTISSSMEKIGYTSSNSSFSKNNSSVNHKELKTHPYFKGSRMSAKYMNSKRRHVNNIYSQMYPDQNSYLHLNSLWSIWYGVFLTLFQGYLAVCGTARFLGCSLIPWKIEPVAELNLQIILSGLVFVLLPCFFTSAVFKVGNLANDGIKLGSGSKERLCSMETNDGMPAETRGSTLRALWTHGGPTSAFIHILIAMCLILPRLLLEGRIIENGLLPRETIWRTELDFTNVNLRSLAVLPIKSSPYENSSTVELQDEENYFNETVFTAQSNNAKAITHLLDNKFNFKQKNYTMPVNEKTTYYEMSNLVGTAVKQYSGAPKQVVAKHTMYITSTVTPSFASTFKYEDVNLNTTNVVLKKNLPIIVRNEEVESTSTKYASRHLEQKPMEIAKDLINLNSFKATSENYASVHSTEKPMEIAKKAIELNSLLGVNSKHNSYHKHHNNLQEHHHAKSFRKHHKQRKINSTTEHPKNHQQFSLQKKSMKKSSRLKDLHLLNYELFDHSIDSSNQDEINFPHKNLGSNNRKVYEHTPSSYEVLDYGTTIEANYTNLSTKTSTTVRDSNIHIVKPEKLPEIIPSTPLSSNSKIIEIRQKTSKKIKREILRNEANHIEIEPDYIPSEFSSNDSTEYIGDINVIESSTTSVIRQPASSKYDVTHLGGFAGILQLFFGVEQPIDLKVFSNPPSAEFANLLFALLVWCVRYPAVFWATTKSFATIFSVQVIASAADIIFSFVGISSLLKLQIYSQGHPIRNPGFILNATITLALFLLSVVLILSSSMVLYLYGYVRLSAKIRDRSIISLSSNESWIYFAHCASLCYILSLCVVKAPLLNDLSATYRNNMHWPTFMAALVSIMHILLWIIIWICLTFKRKWDFKLPPLVNYTIVRKATTQPLLMHSRGNLTKTDTTANLNNSITIGSNSSANENIESKMDCVTSSSDVLNDDTPDNIYWPKITPDSPKLKVTFNEVTSSSKNDCRHRLNGGHKQNNGKRNSSHGTAMCFSSIEGEIDDVEYATLKSGTAVIVGNTLEGSNDKESSAGYCESRSLAADIEEFHSTQYEDLPPPPLNMTSSMTITNHTTAVTVNPRNTYINCLDDGVRRVFQEDNISEEGKLLERVRDDSVTYASTRDFEPSLVPLPPPPPPPPKIDTATHIHGSKLSHKNITKTSECVQLPSSPNNLISPLAPARAAVQTNEAHIAPSSAPRCLRRADSGVPQEALTPRSDTNSCGTESTISPPGQAPSESSSGVHSAEEREIEVAIRPRAISKPLVKLPPPAIQEEPNGRCMNMRMSSFAGGFNTNSATLPLQRSNADEKMYYSQHCSTMPLPMNSHIHNEQQRQAAVYATSAHCMSNTQRTVSNVSSFKTPLYANSRVVMSSHEQTSQHEQVVQTATANQTSQQVTYTTLSNCIRYSKHNILRRHPFIKADSPCGHQTFSKLAYESSLASSTIHEDRDSANYSMNSDQGSFYATANSLH